MKTEIVANANRVNPHRGKTTPIFLEKSKVLGLIGRETDGEIAVVAQGQFSRLQFRVGNSGLSHGTMNLGPKLDSDLSLSRRCNQNDPFLIARQPPERRYCEREGFPYAVT